MHTVYGNQRNRDGSLRDFSAYGSVVATQLTPELVTDTGGKNDYWITHNSLWQRGVRGLIVPSHHLTRGGIHDPSDRLPWRSALQAAEEAGAHVHGVHIEAGRVDTRHKSDRKQTVKELGAILVGPDAIEQTEMGEVLAAAYDIWHRQRLDPQNAHTPEENKYGTILHSIFPKMPATVEIPYNGLAAVRQSRRLVEADFVSMHRDIAVSLHEFFARMKR
jgi:hypothetical protein